MAVDVKAPTASSPETVDFLYTLPSIPTHAKAFTEIRNVLRKYYSCDHEMDYVSQTVRAHVEALRQLQRVYNQVAAEFLKEKADTEAKYWQIYQPSYAKIYEIVNGLVEVEGVPIKDVEAEDDDVKGIPGFWLKALSNNDVVAAEIFENDEEALGYLDDIKWSKTDNPEGFMIEFCFDSNPYFKNVLLTQFYQIPMIANKIPHPVSWFTGEARNDAYNPGDDEDSNFH